MRTRGKYLAALVAAALLLLTACGGPSWSDRRRLDEYRSWRQEQTHVPGLTGTIADGVVSLVTAEPSPVAAAVTLTAPGSR